MVQVRSAPFRTEASSHHRACVAYDGFTRGVKFAPERQLYFRKLRSFSQEPNPLARVFAHISEAKRCGASEVNARLLLLALAEHIEKEYGPERVWSRELVLAAHHAENADNIAEAELLIEPHESPARLLAYQKAKRFALAAGAIAADAAGVEAARLTLGARF